VDPYRRTVVSSNVMAGLGSAIVLAMRLDCGHVNYRTIHRRDAAADPAEARCRVCMERDLQARQARFAPRTPATACIESYVFRVNRRRSVMETARQAVALDGDQHGIGQ
jgi:hypothetical protein